MNQQNRVNEYWISRPDITFLHHIVFLQNLLSAKNNVLKTALCYEPHPELNGLVYLKINHHDADELLNFLTNELSLNTESDKDSNYYQINEVIEIINIYLTEIPLSKDEFFNNQNYIDLDNATYEDFVDFLNHKHVLSPKPQKYQYKINISDNFIAGDLNALVCFYTKFFHDVATWKNNYLDATLNHLFNFIFCYPYDIKSCIYNSKLNLDNRLNLIKSIYYLYESVFIDNAVEEHRFMLWDDIAFPFTTTYFPPSFDIEEKEIIRNTMFDTLKRILNLPSLECQFGALHGLNHLHHHDTKLAVMQYIKDNPNLTKEEVFYAKAYMRFEMM